MGKTKAKCGSVKLEVECSGAVTGDMIKRLNELSEETRRKAKEIIEGKTQDGDEDAAMLKEWLDEFGRNCEKARNDDTSSETEIRGQKIKETVKECCEMLEKSGLTMEEIEIATRSMNQAAEKMKEKEPPKTSKVRRVWF